MTTYVLDSSALLRYIDNEAGGERVGDLLRAAVRGEAAMCISALQWGEISGYLCKRIGAARASRALDSLIPLKLEIVPANAGRAVRAADLRFQGKISYVDCFALELAMESPDHVLVTADFDFKGVADVATIEFLPAK